MTGFGHDWPADEGWSAGGNALYHDGEFQASITCKKGGAELAKRIAHALNAADFNPMKTPLMMAD